MDVKNIVEVLCGLLACLTPRKAASPAEGE
jgi:hypothetical protein